jgi:hypothetical protein
MAALVTQATVSAARVATASAAALAGKGTLSAPAVAKATESKPIMRDHWLPAGR